MATKETLMKVSFLDVGYTYKSIQPEMDEAYQRVMDAGWFIKGKEVENFEAKFAKYCHTKHAIGVGNGLDAIHVILRALKIGQGDEVIVSGHTFIATWMAVSHIGATPVPVDANPKTMNIDVDKIEEKITDKTKAILIVHLYGQTCEMDKIQELSKKHNIPVIEDAAQSHGSTFNGQAAGSFGIAGTFSFYPGKNLGAFGDGGAVTCNDEKVAKEVTMVCNYGCTKKYHHEEMGINSRLDTLQAAFLSVKLNHLDKWNEQRRAIAARYTEELKDVPGLTLPHVPESCNPVWHLYVVRHKKRDELAQKLQDAGIGITIHYPITCHQSGAYKEQFGHISLPVAEDICKTCLSIPIGPHLKNDEVSYVISKVKEICKDL